MDNKKEKIKIRRIKKGEEGRVVNLHNECFNQKISIEQWKWKYQENPDGFRTIVALDKNGKIIGNYGIQFKEGIYKKKINIAHLADLCLDVEYRNRGTFLKMIKYSLKDNFDIAWGFPRDHPFKAYIKYNLSDSPAKVNVYSKKINILKKIFTKKNKEFIIKELSKKDFGEIDNLWSKKEKEIKISSVRDFKRIKWRIIDSFRKSKLFLIKYSGKTIGYFASHEKNKKMFIVDIIILDKYLKKGVIDNIERKAAKEGIREILFLLNGTPLIDILKRSKYVVKYQKNFSYFSKVGKVNPEEIYLTFFDTDAI